MPVEHLRDGLHLKNASVVSMHLRQGLQQHMWVARISSAVNFQQADVLRDSCAHVQGLQQHMRASHDLFDYGFSEDSPMRLPAVSVEVAAGVYSTNHTFQSPEAAAMGDSVTKVGPELSVKDGSPLSVSAAHEECVQSNTAQGAVGGAATVIQIPRSHVTKLQDSDSCSTGPDIRVLVRCAQLWEASLFIACISCRSSTSTARPGCAGSAASWAGGQGRASTRCLRPSASRPPQSGRALRTWPPPRTSNRPLCCQTTWCALLSRLHLRFGSPCIYYRIMSALNLMAAAEDRAHPFFKALIFSKSSRQMQDDDRAPHCVYTTA